MDKWRGRPKAPGIHLRTSSIAGLLLAAYLGTPLAINGAGVVWYVSPQGSDSNACLAPHMPCATIPGALGKASSGDTIRIAAGKYVGNGTEVVLIGKDVHLSGGWDVGFTHQAGTSSIDGQRVRPGIRTTFGVNVTRSTHHRELRRPGRLGRRRRAIVGRNSRHHEQ